MDVVGKSSKDKGSIHQRNQHRYLAKLTQKYFRKFLFTKIDLEKI